MNINRMLVSFITVCVTFFTTVAYAETAGTFTPTQKTQIEGVVHDYLLKNPEIIMQAVQVLQQKQMDKARKSVQKTQELAPTLVDALFRNSADPVVGNAQGKVTIVEFFDYQCPHCVDMTPVIEGLLKVNPDIRVVYKEFPIRGPMSELASKIALAAQAQGKYKEFHLALMKNTQPLTDDVLWKIAQSAGVDVNKAKTDITSKAITDQLKANYTLAEKLQLLGTPAFFIAKTAVAKDAPMSSIAFIPGQVDQKQLQAIVDKINK